MSRALLAALASLLLLPVATDAARNQRAINVKILNGSVAAPGQFPWMAVILGADVPQEELPNGAYCGGAVIAPKVILTAAHCVFQSRARSMHVIVGRTRLSQATEGSQRIQVTKVVVHEDYAPRESLNDVALLQLAEPANVAPLGIARPGEEALAAPGTTVTGIGWGSTFEGGRMNDELLYVRLLARADAACSKVYGEYEAVGGLCVGSDRKGEDTCQGDSGGPVISGEGDALRVIGIVSYGRGCGRRNIPGAYAEVTHYAAWIDERVPVLNGDVAPPPPPENPPVVRIGRIACEAVYCNVFLRTTGRAPTGGIALNYVRRRQRPNRGPVDEIVFARQLSAKKWVARANLPFGRLTLYAIPFNEAMDDLDGDGDAVRVSITHAR